MRREAFAFVDHLAGGESEGGAAHDHRARAVRAHAECDAVGIPVDILDLVRVQPEPLVQDLFEGGLMPLAMRLGSHQQHGAAARVEADLGIFGNGTACRLYRIGKSDAAEHAALARSLSAFCKAGVIGC